MGNPMANCQMEILYSAWVVIFVWTNFHLPSFCCAWQWQCINRPSLFIYLSTCHFLGYYIARPFADNLQKPARAAWIWIGNGSDFITSTVQKGNTERYKKEILGSLAAFIWVKRQTRSTHFSSSCSFSDRRSRRNRLMFTVYLQGQTFLTMDIRLHLLTEFVPSCLLIPADGESKLHRYDVDKHLDVKVSNEIAFGFWCIGNRKRTAHVRVQATI